MSKLRWSNLLENPKAIDVEQFLWGIDISKELNKENIDTDIHTIKDALFNCIAIFSKSEGIQSRVFQLLDDISSSPYARKHAVFKESDLKLR